MSTFFVDSQTLQLVLYVASQIWQNVENLTNKLLFFKPYWTHRGNTD